MKYFILAGEASGDKQAALLSRALRDHDEQAVIKGWGGEAMAAQGVTITRHYRELAYMGFVEVVKHLPAILRNFKTGRKEISEFKPDALILVDYPGFNLRMATWAAEQNFPVYYYISPQLWAWHTSRVYRIKKAVRKMYVILPFEKEFYQKYDMDVLYIGHPLAVELKNEFAESNEDKNSIALLPGSRKHEVERLLPEMIELVKKRPAENFTVAAVSHLPASLYRQVVDNMPNVKVELDNMRGVLSSCKAAIVTSGTATLETALLNVPQVVVYKGSPVSYQIAKRLIKVPYISLVNLIANKKLVPELIQHECNAENINRALDEILSASKHSEILEGYQQIKESLITGGGAETAAIDIISDLKRTIS